MYLGVKLEMICIKGEKDMHQVICIKCYKLSEK